jgi:glucose/arabinose dehydrogenase
MMHAKRLIPTSVAYALLLVLAASDPVVGAPKVTDKRLVLEEFYSGSPLSRPISFDFVGPEKILVIEKSSGIVRLIEPGKAPAQVLDRPVATEFNGGGLGLAVDPNFAKNKYVYVFHTIAKTDGGDFIESQVARYKMKGLGKKRPKLKKKKVILRLPRSTSQVNSGHHHGGYIRFGPDGKLYGMIGDYDRGRSDNPRTEQNTSSTEAANAGAIFRINPDGTVPADNPFSDHAVPEMRKWFVIGVRNGVGMDFQPSTGELWFTENGPNQFDEINRGVAGMNSGWVMIMGPDSRDAEYDANDRIARDEADLPALDGASYRDPIFSFLTPVGITSILFLEDSALPENLRGSVLVADVVTRSLYLFKQTSAKDDFVLKGSHEDRVADSESSRKALVWASDIGTIVDIRLGPDGFVYLSDTSSKTVFRIRPR